MANLTIKAEKYFDHNRLIEFLNSAEWVFKLDKKHKQGVLLDLSRIERVSIINLLVFFKLVEYTYENELFAYPKWLSNSFVDERFRFFGFWSLLKAYMESDDEEKVLKRMKVSEKSGFLIAPQPLLRSDFTFRSKLNSNYLPEIQKYYSSANNAVSIIFTCLSELSLNFWAHATGDSHSILMAYGSKNKIEIGCADNGEGIVSTLKNAFGSNYSKMSNSSILAQSVERGVTSKKGTNHMGYGLWLVCEIVKKMGGILGLYSEGAYLNVKGSKVEKGPCGYWKGTIVYLSLPLDKCFSLEELLPVTAESSKIQINWK